MAPYTNSFFSNTTGVTGEVSLLDDLVREQIKMFGIDLMYLPRRMLNLDMLLHESSKNAFELALPMPMYVKNFDGYDNGMEMLSKFGVRSSDELTLQMSRSEFVTYYSPFLKAYYNSNAGREATDDLNHLEGETDSRPKEGDLIFFPLDDSIFEIKYVNFDQPFFQLGKGYVFELQCERFEYSGEVFSTGYDEVDDSTIAPDFYRMEFDTEVTPYGKGDNTFIQKERVVLLNTIKCDYNHILGGDAYWVQIKDGLDGLDAYFTLPGVDISQILVGGFAETIHSDVTDGGFNATVLGPDTTGGDADDNPERVEILGTDGGESDSVPDRKVRGGLAREQPQYMFFTNGGNSIAVPTEDNVDAGTAEARYGYCDMGGFQLYKDAGYIHKVEKVEATVEYWNKADGTLRVGDITDMDPEQPDEVKDLILNKFDNCLIVGKTSGAMWFSRKAGTSDQAFDDGTLIQKEFDAIKIIDDPGDINPFGFV